MQDQIALSFERYVHRLVGSVLDRLCVPFLLLDAAGLVLFANPMSEAILADGAHIRRDAQGRIACTSPQSAALLRRFLTTMDAASPEIDVMLLSTGGRVPLFASFSPFNPPSHPAFPELQPVCVVFIREGNQDEGIEVARMLYGLSDAEAHSVRAVISGIPLKRHAHERQTSVHTARKQLNMAMKKAGVSSQLQLNKLITELTRGPV